MNNLKTIKILLKQDFSNLSEKEIINIMGLDNMDNAFETLKPIGIILSSIVIAFFVISVFASIKALSFIIDFKIAILIVAFILMFPLYPITSRVVKILNLLLKIIF